MAKNRNTFNGKYVDVKFQDPHLRAGTVTFIRRENGTEFPMVAFDLRDFLAHLVRVCNEEKDPLEDLLGKT